MTCPVCSKPSAGDLCASCVARTRRVRSAGKFVVDRAARKSLDLASEAEGDVGEGLIEYIVAGKTAGRRW